MKLNTLLRVALIGVLFSLSSAQNTYSELDAEIIEEFLTELDEQIEDVLEEALMAKTTTSEVETFLKNEENAIALEEKLEQFEDAVNGDTAARVLVKPAPITKKVGVQLTEEQTVQQPDQSEELAQIEDSLSSLKEELGDLTKQNDQKALELKELTLDASDIPLVQESTSVAQSFAKPVEQEIVTQTQVQELVETSQRESDEEIKRLEQEAAALQKQLLNSVPF